MFYQHLFQQHISNIPIAEIHSAFSPIVRQLDSYFLSCQRHVCVAHAKIFAVSRGCPTCNTSQAKKSCTAPQEDCMYINRIPWINIPAHTVHSQPNMMDPPVTGPDEPNEHELHFPSSFFSEFMKDIRICESAPCRRIPKRVLKQCALAFLELVRNVKASPHNQHDRLYLSIFAKCVLRYKPFNVTYKEQNEFIKRNLNLWSQGPAARRQLFHETVSTRRVRRPSSSQTANNVQRSKRLLELGRYSDSMKALLSSGIADYSQDVLEAIASKHPVTQPPELPIGPCPTPLKVSPPDVLKALSTFPKGSAGGGDGLTADHIRAFFQHCPVHLYDELFQACTDVINDLLAANAPNELAEFLCSAPITPLKKPDGSVRPIAVGEVWRRWTAKCAMESVAVSAKSYFEPLQLGVGTRDGAVAAAHSVQTIVKECGADPSLVMLKFDFTNAFNLVSR